MKRLLLLLMVLVSGVAMAQPQCGFDGAHAQMLQLDSVYKQKVEAANARYVQAMQSSSNGLQVQSGFGTEYEIPLVVHVIHTGGTVGSIYNPSDANINAMINYLNESYAATYASYPDTSSGGVRFPVKFVLAKRDPSCGPSTGINRVDGSTLSGYSLYGVQRNGSNGVSDSAVKSLSLWDNGDYYNIWVVNKIDSNDGTFGTYTAGYAYFPGASSDVDGTVMLATTVGAGNITLPHEIGHAFNLYHTFQGDGTGSTCPTNTNCLTQGDLVCDTEPHRRSPFNCPSDPNPCTASSYNNVQRNFMDYSNCQDRFTAGQRTRWLDALTNQRSGLASSITTLDTNSVNPVAATCTPTYNSSNVGNLAEMGPVQVVLNDMTSSSGGYFLDNYRFYIDRTCRQRANVHAGQSYTLSVSTTTNPQKVAVYLDTSNNGAFASNELIYSHTGSSATETHSTTYTVPTSNIPTCTALRMRVVTDFASSSTPTACSQLDYGQAEDFTVVVRPASDTFSVFNNITSGSPTTCAGSSVTFTATASKTLTSPTYQWYVGTAPQSGATNSTFTMSSLTAGTYYVHCKVNHTGACFEDSSFTNVVVLSVSGTTVTPTVSIAANPGNNICSGTNVVFTATPTNGGTAPVYQWKLNGNNVGTNSATYANATLNNNDQVSVVMTSNDACASPTTATSNTITMSVGTTVTPAVAIAANPGNNICSGTNVTFTATPTNGGTAPSYQWKLNGNNVGINSPTYSNATLANNDQVSVVMTSNDACASPTTATSSTITMSVTTSVTPSVAIAANPGNNICSGTNVTFTATPTNGGTTPSYQWKLNGNNVGTNSATYSNASLANNDQVSVVMTSNATCASPTTATSNTITMSVTTTVAPAVAIAANPGNSICSGTNVTFTATPTNGGTTPSYQWKLNGNNVGTNSATYSNASLANNDQVSVVMTSNATCASPTTATSNTITMSVSTTVTPAVAIAANPGNMICSGTNVTFTATPTNGGGTPSYQWKLNGNNVGTNSATYSNASLANNDQVSVVMTSSATCASPTTVTSNTITMTVTATVAPAVAIAANPGNSICSGTNVTFTATPTNGGTTPSYQWKLNGNNVGTNSATYANATLADNDQVSVVMTSNSSCASPTTATSNTITMSVTGNTASVSIASNKGTTVCSGEQVIFTATPTNGGTTPSYQWKINGNNAGANSNTFSTTSLNNGDVVTVVLTSSSVCVTNGPATSNSLNMTVNPTLTPVIAIALTPNDTICDGTMVTFTATIANGGSTPAYQWKLNGNNVGTNSNTYMSSTLDDGDVVTCVLTSSEVCVTQQMDTSNAINMTVRPILTPMVTISVNPGSTICDGASATFTATPTNGGTNPTYQWKRNGVTVGTNSSTYTTTTLANGDAIVCVMTSSEQCVSKSKDTSNTINMTVNPNLTPSVSITVSPSNTVCAGTSVTFTATPTNGGTLPAYQWKVNGFNTGPNSNTFTTSSLSDGDVVTVVLTSSEPCVTSSTATSNAINMTVNPIITPMVSVSVSPNDTVCAGTNVTFTATPTNGGTAPTYQWQLNGLNAGTGPTYSGSNFSNGDMVRVIMTSNGVCLTKPADTSANTRLEVIPNVTPTVVITRFPSDTICAGTNVTFTATAVNQGASPTYQWQVNGVNAGTNSATFNTTTLANGDVVRCILTSSITCVTKQSDTSNNITIGVKSRITPVVTITASPNDTACAGDNITFTAVATNAGTTPSYEWQVNGASAGTNSNTFMTTTLNDGDMVRCIVTTSDTCVTKSMDTSNVINMTINPILTPVVTITVSPNDTVCDGDMVTFTATPTNGGTNPTYQWRVNGTNVGTNSTTYSSSTLSNNDVVDVIMTSSELCVTKQMDTSNAINMTVKPNLTPDVTIIALPGNTVCDGTNVTFIATPVNEGTTPGYQWQVNGVNVGTNNASYSTTTLANGDVVRVILTSSEMCVTKQMDTSNVINMTVNPNLTPDVTITVSPDDTICVGTSTTFTATPTNGGTTPAYQWQVNGTNVGTNSNTYTSTTLVDGDMVRVILTSSETCVTKAMDTSNVINMTVKPFLTPVVTITESPNDTICAGTNVTFTATPTNGGTPTYQWQINGSNVGTNSTTFSSSTLQDNDVVRVIMTSSEMCLTKPDDTSNEVTMEVIPIVTPDVTITVTPNDTVCDGTIVSFLATPVNGGTAPSYQWKINSTNVGLDNPGFATSSLVDGDTVRVIMTSNAQCTTKAMDTSNDINMTIIPLTKPTVGISANTGTTSCVGGEVTFSANFSNGGTAQTYQWRLNGADIAGATANTYMSNTLATGDMITLRMDITAACPDPDSAISNTLTMNMVVPSMSIMVSPNDTLCDNEPAVFTVVNKTNIGSNALYQWELNSVDQNGVVSDVFTMNTVSHQDVINVRYTGSDNCINAPATQAANPVTMTIRTTAPPSVGIAANPGDVVNEGQIVFYTSSVNAPNASYQWRKNGLDIPGATGPVYTDVDPVDGDSITLFVVTNDTCRMPDTAVSNLIVMKVIGVGVREIEQQFFESVSLAPNPNNGTFSLNGTLAKGATDEVVYVEVVNAVGQVIYKEPVQLRNHELKTRIELGDKAHNGLHIVRITAEGRVHLLKFIANR